MNTAVQPASATPQRTPPRMIEVLAIEHPHPDIKRVIFSGEKLLGFPDNRNGAHIKLFFPKPHQIEPTLPTLGANGPIWPSAIDRPITRTYSVRYYNSKHNLLAIDFVWHSHRGPAQQWLSQIKTGQRIGLAGPGGPDPLIYPAKHQIFIGDTSALAAILALTEVPSSCQKYVFLVADHVSEFAIPPAYFKLFKPQNYATLGELYQDLLVDLAEQLQLRIKEPSGNLAAFVAGENTLVLSARDYLRQEYHLNKKNLYAIPYWRLGEDEEAYHQTRHRIMDEVY